MSVLTRVVRGAGCGVHGAACRVQGAVHGAWCLVQCAVVALLLIAGCSSVETTTPAARRTPVVEELRPAPGALALPVKDGSVRFAVIGDAGRGDKNQYDTAQQLAAWRARYPFDFILMLGDNIYIYDKQTPQDYPDKFEKPYAPLLEAGVKFYAAIGNHDDPTQIYYAPFNMDGKRYYTFRKGQGPLGAVAGGGVRFFVLDSRSFDPDQLAWLKQELADSGSPWKIAYFHHPLYTSGRYQWGARALRREVEPLLIAGDVDVVLSGHEHFYERLQPQNGIIYFVSGAGGALRRNDIRASPATAKGFDDDCHFMLMEISGDKLYFQAISRTGETVDAGVITRSDRSD